MSVDPDTAQIVGFVAVYLFIVLMGWLATLGTSQGDDHDAL